MIEIAESYKGREHSWIKHELLRSYLATVLSIICVSGKARSITYVDCFAGPWGDESDDLAGTSIAISLRILDEVQRDPRNRGIKFNAIYVEKDKNSFKRLKEYLDRATPAGIKSYAMPGDYFDQQDEILRLCGTSFAFFFIDPKGWTSVTIDRLKKLLRRPHSEYLINLMYDFVNRAIGMEGLRPQVEALLGPLSPEEAQRFSGLAPKERGDFVVRKYRKELKAVMSVPSSPRPRSYHAEILNKEKERLHYHLVYLTRHPKGVVKFAEESQDADYLQTLMRVESQRSAAIQTSLFSSEEEVAQKHGVRVDLEQIKRRILSDLSVDPKVCDEKYLADLLEETAWFVRDIEQALGELIAQGTVRNLDALRRRPKHPVNFVKGERLLLAS